MKQNRPNLFHPYFFLPLPTLTYRIIPMRNRPRWPIILDNIGIYGLRGWVCAALRHKHIRPAEYGLRMHIEPRPPGQSMLGYCDDDDLKEVHIYLYFSTLGPINPEYMSRVLDHELDHVLGWDHHEMIADELRDVSWASGYALRRK